jgi:hypothetical protein
MFKVTNELIADVLRKHFSCEVWLDRYVVQYVEDGGALKINIPIVSKKEVEATQGIFLQNLETREDFEHHLVDAVQSALKDGFSNIFIIQ